MNEKIGCVIMASGMARRFGSNKLLHNFLGEPVMNRILRTMSAAPLAAKVVVTRHPEIKDLCDEQGIPVVLHDMPLQSDTVALGVTALLEMCPDMTGCMFAASDQPCLRVESVAALCEAFQREPGQIWRMCWMGTVGNPVVFPKFTFNELLHDNNTGTADVFGFRKESMVAYGAEYEVGVLLGHVIQLCLCAVEETFSEYSSRAYGYL